MADESAGRDGGPPGWAEAPTFECCELGECTGTAYVVSFNDGNSLIAWTDCIRLAEDAIMLDEVGLQPTAGEGIWKGSVRQKHDGLGSFFLTDDDWQRVPAPWDDATRAKAAEQSGPSR